MTLLQNLLLAALVLAFAGVEIATRSHRRYTATPDDTRLELFMLLSLVAVSQPLIFIATGKLAALAAPGWRDAWAHWPWWAMALALLVGDDLTQYLWHRASHTPLLWPLHRAHHTRTT